MDDKQYRHQKTHEIMDNYTQDIYSHHPTRLGNKAWTNTGAVLAAVRPVSGSLRQRLREAIERRVKTPCEGILGDLRGAVASPEREWIYARLWKNIQSKMARKVSLEISRNKQEKARRQGGAFAVYTARQSRAGGLETTGSFGSCHARRDRCHNRVTNRDLM